MFKRIFFILICLALLTATAWAESLVNGSSFDEYKKSVRVLHKELSGNKQKLFEKAAGYYEAMFEWSAEAGKSDPEIKERTDAIMHNLNGKTADDMIDLYIMVVQENYNMTKIELEEARKYVENAKKSNELIEGFEILDAKFYYDETGGGLVPMIGLGVYNGTKYVITHIYLKAKVFSKGRVIPWFEEEFNFGVPNGVKVKELAEWELMTDAAAGWNTIPKRDDLEISLEVVKLGTADGRELSAQPLPEKQEEYFKILAEQLDVFTKELEELRKLTN